MEKRRKEVHREGKEPSGAVREKSRNAWMVVRRKGEKEGGTAQSKRTPRAGAALDTTDPKPVSFGIWLRDILTQFPFQFQMLDTHLPTLPMWVRTCLSDALTWHLESGLSHLETQGLGHVVSWQHGSAGSSQVASSFHNSGPHGLSLQAKLDPRAQPQLLVCSLCSDSRVISAIRKFFSF